MVKPYLEPHVKYFKRDETVTFAIYENELALKMYLCSTICVIGFV